VLDCVAIDCLVSLVLVVQAKELLCRLGVFTLELE